MFDECTICCKNLPIILLDIFLQGEANRVEVCSECINTPLREIIDELNSYNDFKAWKEKKELNEPSN